MIVSGADIYEDYQDVNNEIDRCTWIMSPKPPHLSDDRNAEDPALIIGVRKWIDSGLSAEGPYLGNLGLTMVEHVALSDKYDIFIYER